MLNYPFTKQLLLVFLKNFEKKLKNMNVIKQWSFKKYLQQIHYAKKFQRSPNCAQTRDKIHNNFNIFNPQTKNVPRIVTVCTEFLRRHGLFFFSVFIIQANRRFLLISSFLAILF